MIKLTKHAEPNHLQQNAVAWTQAVVGKLAAGQVPTAAEKTRYRHPDIKAALVNETHGKCAYCESRLRHIHHGDVEHIFPKSLDPSLSFNWPNLTLACEVCNQNKSNRDPLVEHIIDPYALDPELHLIFHGVLIFSRGTPEGTSTRIILELHRADLVEMRNDQIEKIMGIYAQVLDVNLPLATRRALYQDLLDREAGPAAPYTAMARCLVRSMAHVVPIEVSQ